MIEVRGLTKRYDDVLAVDDVSFAIEPGEAFGLLGPNGAGKTTTLLMAVGALAPDSGEVLIGGERGPERAELRRLVGYAPQGLAIYEELSASENLSFFGRLYGLAGAALAERVAFGLAFAGLEDAGAKRAAKFSGGMKRRLNLACALVHEPKVLFCDEPTVGVDPQSRNHIFESIERLKDEGCTLVYTTHYMEEAQRLCDRVAIVDHGRLLALDTVDALIAQHGGDSIVQALLAGPPPAGAELPGELDGLRLLQRTSKPLEAVAALSRAGVDIAELHVERPDLERVFLSLTGRSLRD